MNVLINKVFTEKYTKKKKSKIFGIFIINYLFSLGLTEIMKISSNKGFRINIITSKNIKMIKGIIEYILMQENGPIGIVLNADCYSEFLLMVTTFIKS